MQFSLDEQTCALGVGEFAGFTLGPRDAGAGRSAGIWRAQLGQQWHARLRAEVEREVAAQPAATAAFEVPLTLGYVHRGWRFTFTGRIDQLVTAGGAALVREIKTVAGPLPAEVPALRADYPDYFVQVLTYLALLRVAPRPVEGRGSRAESEPGLPSTFRPSTLVSPSRARLRRDWQRAGPDRRPHRRRRGSFPGPARAAGRVSQPAAAGARTPPPSAFPARLRRAPSRPGNRPKRTWRLPSAMSKTGYRKPESLQRRD